MAEIIAVDVGGTFTDIVVFDLESGGVSRAKVPTTPDDQAAGVLNAIEKSGVQVSSGDLFFHGTTIGLNAVIEGTGARTALLTTEGFRDELEIARLRWPMYRLQWEKPAPLVERFLRREVPERLAADGTVLRELDEASVTDIFEDLSTEGVESIAVCFLHSYAFPFHEERVGNLIDESWPEVAYSLSHQVSREYREFERSTTTVVDAMIKPELVRYIGRVEKGLAKRGFKGRFFVTRCDGGVMTTSEVRERGIRTLISGPVSGVMGAAAIGKSLDMDRILAIDMGGTSFDGALITDYEPTLKSIGHLANGVPLLMPQVDMATIGAGGGSIAWIDSGGALEIGPQSAGADPGPICYGKGGTEPTFTDAAVVSGLIDPGRFLGGEIELDADLAFEGIEAHIAKPLGISVSEAASGIVAVAEAKMAGILESITVAKGVDPRDFVLLAYGGGGPLVASALARRLGIGTIVIPVSPATFSAWGMLTLEIVHDFATTSVSPLQNLTIDDLDKEFRKLEAEGVAALERDGVPKDRHQLHRFIDMRYENQEHTLTLPFARQTGEAGSPDLRAQFDAGHERAYGYALTAPVEVTCYRLRALGGLDKPPTIAKALRKTPGFSMRKGQRSAWHRDSGGSIDFALYDRAHLAPDRTIEGPAIVEEESATTLVGPNQVLTVNFLDQLIITEA